MLEMFSTICVLYVEEISFYRLSIALNVFKSLFLA